MAVGEETMSNILEDLLTPGTGVKIVPFVNRTLGALIAVLLFSALRWQAVAVHLYVMIFLALGLLASLNWFAAEMKKSR
jgi:uncharacterized membrane protein YqjE